MIERATGFVVDELTADAYLKGLDRATFIARLAQHYDQLNYVHLFREGNGRTQRTFWDRIARWYLDWIGVTGDVNDHASRVGSENLDLGSLIAMFDRIVAPR